MINLPTSLLITRIITLLVAFTIHEFSHALAATALGDDTPRREGRLTLNPMKHLDLWGCIMLIVTGFGWAKPVRVNQRSITRKTGAGMMLTAAAGPLSNLLLAVIGAYLLRSRALPNVLIPGVSWLPRTDYFLRNFILTNLTLMVFNLVPLAPLDGEKVIGYFIPGSFKRNWQLIQSHGSQILMILFFVLPYIRITFASDLISNLSYALYRVVIGG